MKLAFQYDRIPRRLAGGIKARRHLIGALTVGADEQPPWAQRINLAIIGLAGLFGAVLLGFLWQSVAEREIPIARVNPPVVFAVKAIEKPVSDYAEVRAWRRFGTAASNLIEDAPKGTEQEVLELIKAGLQKLKRTGKWDGVYRADQEW